MINNVKIGYCYGVSYEVLSTDSLNVLDSTFGSGFGKMLAQVIDQKLTHAISFNIVNKRIFWFFVCRFQRLQNSGVRNSTAGHIFENR